MGGFLAKWIKPVCFTLVFAFGQAACNLFSRCPEVRPYFAIEGLQITNMRYTGVGSLPWEVLQNEGPVDWDDLFFSVNYAMSYYAGITGGGAQLYALSCPENGYLGTQTGLDTLYLVTLNDYNERFQRNDTLNNILLAKDWLGNTRDFAAFTPLAEYIGNNREVIKDMGFNLKLTEAPAVNFSYHRFRVIYQLTNGMLFTAVTDSVKLRN